MEWLKYWLKLISILALFSFSHAIYAFEILYKKIDSSVLIAVDNIDYPKSIFEKELLNGLPNQLDYILKINSKKEDLIDLQILSYIITYDLWEEYYFVETFVNQSLQEKVAKSKKELRGFLEKIEFPMFPLPNSDILISVEVVFNPIQTEKIKKIKNWVAARGEYSQNNSPLNTIGNGLSQAFLTQSRVTSLPGGAQSSGGANALRSSGPRFKKLFDKIIDQYMEDSGTASALWRSEKVQKKIKLNQLE